MRTHSPLWIHRRRSEGPVRRRGRPRIRKLWIMFSLRVGTLITPPDVLSQRRIALPMIARREIQRRVACFGWSKVALFTPSHTEQAPLSGIQGPGMKTPTPVSHA